MRLALFLPIRSRIRFSTFPGKGNRAPTRASIKQFKVLTRPATKPSTTRLPCRWEVPGHAYWCSISFDSQTELIMLLLLKVSPAISQPRLRDEKGLLLALLDILRYHLTGEVLDFLWATYLDNRCYLMMPTLFLLVGNVDKKKTGSHQSASRRISWFPQQ